MMKLTIEFNNYQDLADQVLALLDSIDKQAKDAPPPAVKVEGELSVDNPPAAAPPAAAPPAAAPPAAATGANHEALRHETVELAKQLLETHADKVVAIARDVARGRFSQCQADRLPATLAALKELKQNA